MRLGGLAFLRPLAKSYFMRQMWVCKGNKYKSNFTNQITLKHVYSTQNLNNHITLFIKYERIHHSLHYFTIISSECLQIRFSQSRLPVITAACKAFRVACMYVSPKAIWECALDQGSENKVIDLGLQFIILEILVNSIY